LTDLLIYARAVHFAASIMAAGTVFFLIFIAEPAFRAASEAMRVRAFVRYRLTWIAWGSLAVAAISGAAWLVFTAASMSGRPPARVFAQGVLWTVLDQTEFGNDWLLRSVLACLLAAAFAPILSAPRIKSVWFKAALAVLAAALVGSLAWAGHAAGGVGVEAIVHPAADILHLIAAAAWLGALVPLALLLSAAGQDSSIAIARTATLRFSTLGIASVGTLLVSGIINSWYLVGSIPALLGADYGRLLLAKIALFFGMVAIAAVNRLRLTPRIAQDLNLAVPRGRRCANYAATPRSRQQWAQSSLLLSPCSGRCRLPPTPITNRPMPPSPLTLLSSTSIPNGRWRMSRSSQAASGPRAQRFVFGTRILARLRPRR